MRVSEFYEAYWQQDYAPPQEREEGSVAASRV